jgi:predicted metal-binding membrane protein
VAASPGLSGAPATLRRVAWTVPEWPWLVLASGAWVALAAHAAHARPAVAWPVMVVAMMVPAALPILRAISLEGLWSRRYRAPAIFLASYVAIWSLFGVLALGAWALASDDGADRHAHLVMAAILLAAAGWQVTRPHRRALKRCHRRRPVGVRGLAADRACAGYGAYHARQCVVTCWPLMLAMAPAHLPVLMAAVAALSTWQRLVTRPRRSVAVAGLLVLALAALAI